MRDSYRNKFNRHGERRYEIRVRYVNGSYGVFGYCDNPHDADAISIAERQPGVDKARIINPKTNNPFATLEEIGRYE